VDKEPMAKETGERRNSEIQQKLAVIAGCSWLLFLRRRPEKPSVSAAAASPPAVNSCVISDISQRWAWRWLTINRLFGYNSGMARN
jgi:hypothetical protein